MNKIAVVTDTSVYLDKNFLEKNKNLKVIPLSILLPNGKEIDDDDLINEDDFYNILKNNIVKTSQTPIGIIEKNWDEYLEIYDKLIIIGISKEISNQYSSCLKLSKKNKYKNKVIVFDTNSVSILLEKVIIATLKYIKTNDMSNQKQINELQKIIYDISSNNYVLLFPQSLETLKKGGRISKTVVAFFNLTKINPILKFENGKIEKFGTTRSYIKGFKKQLYKSKKEMKSSEIEILITHYDNPEITTQLKEIINNAGFKKINYIKFPKVILAHLGNNLIGFNIVIS